MLKTSVKFQSICLFQNNFAASVIHKICRWDVLHYYLNEGQWRAITAFLYIIFPSNYKILPCYAHDNVIKWKHFPGYYPFVRGNHGSTLDSPHKGKWRGALMSWILLLLLLLLFCFLGVFLSAMFSLICAGTNGWANNRDAGDLSRHRAHYESL